jgi:hypothetical protein
MIEFVSCASTLGWRSGYVAQLRFEGPAELHDARFQFDGGAAHPGEMVHAVAWFRDREAVLAIARPKMRFDVLERGQVVATGEVLGR